MVNGKGTGITIDDMVQVATRAGMLQSEALSIAREIQERVHATLALLPID
ncbi:hypothetical protein [Adlercreutzia sp. ZJ138]|nr:hypothetical protein [Adlercreutzia sp. ZJ138]